MGPAAPGVAAALARGAAARGRARDAGTGQLRRAVAHPGARARSAERGLQLRGEGAVAEPAEYAALLAATGAEVDVWETTYLHRLTGPDPVLEWIGSTALRPVRDALDDEAYASFRAELAPRLRTAYPARPDGTTWFPFRRIFAVARVR